VVHFEKIAEATPSILESAWPILDVPGIRLCTTPQTHLPPY
jgi:hypothetical protein